MTIERYGTANTAGGLRSAIAADTDNGFKICTLQFPTSLLPGADLEAVKSFTCRGRRGMWCWIRR